MTKRKSGDCKNCGNHVGTENLSNNNLCYRCARELMIGAFDRVWALGHPTKRPIGGK